MPKLRMLKTIKILIVDDHPIIVDAYKNSIILNKSLNTIYKLKIDFALCLKTAKEKLTNPELSNPYDLVFLDISFPKSENEELKSGEDLGVFIKKKMPEIKIIVITGFFNEIVLGNILNNIGPEALLLKGDVEASIIPKALLSVLNGIPFYSSSILKLLRKKLSSNVILSKIDKQLLYELSKGIKTKDLTDKLPLSIGGIEKRKRQLKELFNTSKKDDETLIESAKKQGFI